MKLSWLRAVRNTVPLGERLGGLTPHEIDYIIGNDVATKDAGDRTADAAGSTTRQRA